MSEDKPLSERVRDGEFDNLGTGYATYSVPSQTPLPDQIAALESQLAHRDQEIERLRERLEMTIAYDVDGNPVKAPEGMPDGIACRNATIRLLEMHVAELKERVAELEKDHNKSLGVGEYTIIAQDTGGFWIVHKSGEGMQTPNQKFEGLVSEYYQREF
jgi:hypothetical protein